MAFWEIDSTPCMVNSEILHYGTPEATQLRKFIAKQNACVFYLPLLSIVSDGDQFEVKNDGCQAVVVYTGDPNNEACLDRIDGSTSVSTNDAHGHFKFEADKDATPPRWIVV